MPACGRTRLRPGRATRRQARTAASRTRLFQIAAEPVEHGAPPYSTVPRAQHPVTLVREIQELGVDAVRFGARERLESFRDIDAVVVLSVDDQHRRLPVL